MSNVAQFRPEWACPPGVTIRDLLEERGQSIREFASAMGDSVEHVQQLLIGAMPINRELADHLSSVLGSSAQFWLTRESQFREGLCRLAKNEEWIKELPVGDLIRFKWMRNATSTREKIAACLDYFGVATVSEWYSRYEGEARLAAFRTSGTFTSSEGAVLAWLRKGEIDASAMECAKWDPEKFRSLLPGLRALTREKHPSAFVPALQKACAECGIAVVAARAPSGCKASGATRFLSPTKALLMLSFRYLSDDHLWFSFFHEAGHLLLHDSRALFLEGGDLCTGEEEQEANNFASDQLVPQQHQAAMKALPVNGRAVIRFARHIGISPGIVVGQLQHLGILTRRQLNNLKVRYVWAED